MENYTAEERIRMQEAAEINQNAGPREALEKEYGQVWDTQQLQEDFTVTGFAAPYVSAVKKSDGTSGSLKFQHSPRFYFLWVPDVQR